LVYEVVKAHLKANGMAMKQGTIIMVSRSRRSPRYNHLPIKQRQLCWAHLICDLTAIAERSGAS
jgi:hypothetical protein